MKKNKFLLLLMTVFIGAVLLMSCDFLQEEGEKDQDDPEETECEHNWVYNESGSLSPTCAEEGYDLYVCSLCGETQKETKLATGNHIYTEDNICKNCGRVKDATATFSDGDLQIYVYESNGEYDVYLDGKGTMRSATPPWKKYNPTVRSVRVRGSNVGLCNKAFENCTNLKKIIVTGSLASVGDRCFAGCTLLTELSLTTGIKSIGKEAFAGCTGVTDVTVADSLQTMGESAFSGCDHIKNLSIPFVGSGDRTGKNILFASIFTPADVTDYTQKSSSSPTTYYTVPTGLKTVTVTGSGALPSYAFAYYQKELQVVISVKVKTVEEYAFYENKGLTSFSIADGGKSAIDSIGKYAFFGCTALAGTFVLPDGVESIEERTFSDCMSLENISFGTDSKLTTINTYAFYGCSSLTKMILPSSVTTIAQYAFSYCSGLKKVSIPRAVTSIGKGAFSSCTKMESIYLQSTKVVGCLDNGSNLFDNGTGLYVYIATDIVVSEVSYLGKKENGYRKVSNTTENEKGINYYLWMKK